MSKLDDVLNSDDIYEKDGYNGYQLDIVKAKKDIKALFTELIDELRDSTPAVNFYADDLKEKVEQL